MYTGKQTGNDNVRHRKYTSMHNYKLLHWQSIYRAYNKWWEARGGGSSEPNESQNCHSCWWQRHAVLLTKRVPYSKSSLPNETLQTFPSSINYLLIISGRCIPLVKDYTHSQPCVHV